ncbi:S-adenosylmethionine:tRNA ribosyltransferase-isomerase [Thalassobacillus sp. CUG 92003]|uniref:S-adenosylmethionine:tRNA ribosyltransferase-isomerase n=1 Tax=Thalassobacillus sp. CUG 92003 TaxID=2736641 RepID=UPI0015E79B22|nr:S-adenosylmethionine:tRNA ribosyltransferase-isomerase [Thalassobacillus sp. CUG 92003]
MTDTAFSFTIPDTLNASEPAEYRGRNREDVKLMVLDRLTGKTRHGEFSDISAYFHPGDVLVLNRSRTMPSQFQAKVLGESYEMRLAREVEDGVWEVLLLPDALKIGTTITLADGYSAEVVGEGSESPLQTVKFELAGEKLLSFFYQYGAPVYYEYITEPWPLDAYQTVYSSVPGSVEMTSAGRPFSWRTLNALRNQGVQIAFLELHTSLSYYSHNRWPTPSSHPENYHIPKETTEMIERAAREGNRVIAAGTTVVRALESAAVSPRGTLHYGKGVSRLYIDRHHELKVVNGLITGFHEPEASHLDLLTAIVSEKYLMEAYQVAIDQHYLWHEFGDINLIM